MHLAIQSETAWRGAPRYIVTGAWKPKCPSLDAGAPTQGMSMMKTGCDCGCGGGLGSLGDASTLSPADALNAAIAQGTSAGLKLNPTAFQNAAWMAKAESQIASGAFDVSWYSPSCGGQTVQPMNLLAVGGGIALSIGGAATGIMVATQTISAVTGAVLGAATLGVGALISVISMIFQHHAQAVQRDLSFGCSALPAVNNAFAVVNQAVRSGQTTPAAAAQSLAQIYSEYQSAGTGGAINNSPWCNSNCEMGVVLQGMVNYWQSQYNAMAAPAASAASSSASTPVTVQPTSAGTQIPLSSTPGAALTQGAQAAPSTGFSSGWLLALLGLGAAWAFL